MSRLLNVAVLSTYFWIGITNTTAQQPVIDGDLRNAIGLQQSGEIAGAISAYQRYLSNHSDSLIALSNLGAAYAHEGQYENAIKQYKRALEVDPTNNPVRLNLALAHYKAGAVDEAVPLLIEVHKAHPEELQPILLLADSLLALGKNSDVVLLLKPIASKRPEDLGIAYLLGTALVRDGQVAEGQVMIDKILKNGDSAEARFLMGTTKLQVRDYPGALTDLREAVRLNPKLPDIYSFYAQALESTGDADGAVDAFRAELAANPNDFKANLQLGAMLNETGSFDEALTHLLRALQVRPGDLAVRFQLASIDFKRGKIDSAEKILEAIVRESPKFTQAHVLLATAYYRDKRKKDADRERAIVKTLTEETQAQEPGVNVK